MEFVKRLDSPIDFQVLKDNWNEGRYDDNTGKYIQKLLDCYHRFGPLNFSKLVQDKFLKLERNTRSANSIGITIETEKDDERQVIIKIGQMDKDKNLCGVGQKISVCPYGGDIWEGQWKDNELSGFARWITVYWEQDFS